MRLSRTPAGVFLLSALLVLCLGGRRIQGPTRGTVEADDGTPLENVVVRLRCGGYGIHGGHTTDSETTVARGGETFRFLWAWGGISPIGCSVRVFHPAYVTAYAPLEDRFSQDLGTIRLQSWKDFLAAGATDPPAHSAYPWPVLEIQQHLSGLQHYWLSAHREGDLHAQAPYVPALRQLFDDAIARAPTSWHANSPWNSQLQQQLRTLAEETGYSQPAERATLLAAAAAGDVAAIITRLAAGVDANAWDPSGFAPLHLATRNGHLPAVTALLDGGAELDRQHLGAGPTALLDAIEKRNDELALFLIDRGADVTIASWRGSPLMRAARYSVSDEVLAALLARGAVEGTNAEYAVDILHVAARSGKTAVMQAILSSGVPADAIRGKPGFTALMGAAHHDREQAARLLIESGADVNARTDDGKSALSIAREQESPHVTALLIEAGARN